MTTTLQRLERYLHAQMELNRLPEPPPAMEPPRVQPFVTISREAGAGGHSLAEALLDTFEQRADQLVFGDWQMFDQRLCEIVASDPAYSESLEQLLTEEYRRPTADLVYSVLRSSLDQDFVMTKVFRTVQAVASIGKAIIIGRGGAHVTAGMPAGVRLRIVAPFDDRVRRVMEVYGLTERQARTHAKNLDNNRARLVKSNFGVDIDDPTLYDAVWNTAATPTEEIAVAVAALVEVRAGALTPG